MDWVNWASFGLFLAVLATAAVIDWRTELIPNWLTLSGAAVALVLAAIGGGVGDSTILAGLGWSALGLVVALVPCAVIFFMGGLGGGDVKLMAVVGAFLADYRVLQPAEGGRFRYVMDAAIYALVLACVMAVAVMIRRRLVKQTLGRIVGAAMTALARSKPQLPTDSPRVPVALAIAVAGLLAGTTRFLGWEWPWHAVMGR